MIDPATIEPDLRAAFRTPCIRRTSVAWRIYRPMPPVVRCHRTMSKPTLPPSPPSRP